MLPILLAAAAACAPCARPSPALPPEGRGAPGIAGGSGRQFVKRIRPLKANGVAKDHSPTAAVALEAKGVPWEDSTRSAVALEAYGVPWEDSTRSAVALEANGVPWEDSTRSAVARVASGGAATAAGVPYRVVRFAPQSPLPADTPVRRPRAIEHSDAYYTRLTIHRIGSYVILPLCAAEYVVGQRLLNEEPTPGGIKGLHAGLAIGVVSVFGLNTITGVWNLWEARHDSEGRARRTLHAVSMLLADGGFASTALIRPHRRREITPGGIIRTFDSSRATTHKGLAIASISLATASTAMMWLWH